jgi:hypothetical protein
MASRFPRRMALSRPKGQINPFYNKHLQTWRFRAVDSTWNHVVGRGVVVVTMN